MTMTYHQIVKRSRSYETYVQKSMRKTWNILEGSIRSSKSVVNAQAYAANLLASPDNLHIVAATTLSVAKSVWMENDGLGLAYILYIYA